MKTITVREIQNIRDAKRVAYIYPRLRQCSVDGGKMFKIIGTLPIPANPPMKVTV